MDIQHQSVTAMAAKSIAMRSVRSLIAIVFGLISIGAAELRQPKAKWVVNFDAAQCTASRNYGTPEAPLFLVIKLPPLGNVVQVGVLRGSQREEAEQVNAEVVIDQRAPIRASMFSFKAKDQKVRAFMINLPVEQFAPAKTANLLRIHGKSHFDEQFAISSLGPLMKIMDQCVADLRNVWNVRDASEVAQGAAGHRNLKEPPKANLQGLIDPEDYPAVAIDRTQSGTASLAMLIDEAGRVAECTVVGTSGAASLDVQGCAILKERARFKPAIGLDGKPAKGSFLQRITWRVDPNYR